LAIVDDSCLTPVNIGLNECCVQLIGLICLGFGVFMMVWLQRLVNEFLEPSLKNVKGKSFAI